MLYRTKRDNASVTEHPCQTDRSADLVNRTKLHEAPAFRQLDVSETSRVSGGAFLAGCVGEHYQSPVEAFLEGFYSTCGCRQY